MIMVFWAALVLVGFAYAGYPVVMLIRARWHPLPVRSAAGTPGMDVLMIVHNGAPWIVAKQANLLALDYPPEALRINIVCDGCDDRTEELLRDRKSGV